MLTGIPGLIMTTQSVITLTSIILLVWHYNKQVPSLHYHTVPTKSPAFTNPERRARLRVSAPAANSECWRTFLGNDVDRTPGQFNIVRSHGRQSCGAISWIINSTVIPQHISVSAVTLKLAAAGTTNGPNDFIQHFCCLYCCERACR